MDKRSYESPMDWEYQNSGPMDPSSPFAKVQQQHAGSFGNSHFNTFGQSNPFGRTQGSPSRPAPFTAGQSSSISSSNNVFGGASRGKPATAAPFRNSAFTTPRKPFDNPDILSEASAAESSPAGATDASDFADTPEPERNTHHGFGQLTITPASMNNQWKVRRSGRGEIGHMSLAARDKIRKRKRYNDDREVSGYRLPYVQQGDWEDSSLDSDDSTTQPGRASPRKTSGSKAAKQNGRKAGWLSGFLKTLSAHPDAPSVLGHWVQFFFSLTIFSIAGYVVFIIFGAARHDFGLAAQERRAAIVEEMSACASRFTENGCTKPVPALVPMCEEWRLCMEQNPNEVKGMRTGLVEVIELLNEALEAMSWKTMAVTFVVIMLVFLSGRSTYQSFKSLPKNPFHLGGAHHTNGDPAQPSQPAFVLASPQQLHWAPISQTPHRVAGANRGMLTHQEGLDTEGDTDDGYSQAMLMSPSKRGRSPRKDRSRSPHKQW